MNNATGMLGLKPFWYNMNQYPFEPYRAMETFDTVSAKYGEVKIKQIELIHAYKILIPIEIKDEWCNWEEQYKNRFSLYDTNPEWFIQVIRNHP